MERYFKLRGCWLAGLDPTRFPTLLFRHDGRWDLRGISLDISLPKQIDLPGGQVFDVSKIQNRNLFHKVQFRDFDFSYANLDGAYFEDCLFENVLFQEARGYAVDDKGSVFRNVDFFKASWRGATLGFDGARYEHANFQHADLRGIRCYRGYFIDCDFSEAKLVDTDFRASHFIRCKFKGQLKKIWFRGYYSHTDDEATFGKTEPNPMEDVDFSEADLREVSFTGDIDLSRVIPPQDGKHILYQDWPGTLVKAQREVQNKWEGVFQEQALGKIRSLSMIKRSMNIVNLADIEEIAAIGFPDPSLVKEFCRQFADLLVRSVQ